MKKTLCIFIIILMAYQLNAQISTRPAHWQKRYRLFEAEKDSISKDGYVFLGNSLTEGFNLKKYFPDWPAVNRGIVSEHLDGLFDRLGNSAVDLKPKKLFLMIGINDIGDKRSDDYIKKMYTSFLDTLTQQLPQTEIYIQSILPVSPRWANCPPDQIIRINNFLEQLASQRNAAFVNLYPFFVKENKHIKDHLSRDGAHLNAKGYQIWADHLKKYLNP